MLGQLSANSEPQGGVVWLVPLWKSVLPKSSLEMAPLYMLCPSEPCQSGDLYLDQ